MDVLNAILNKQFDTPMLMTAFSAQLLVPKHKNFPINTLMTMLKQSSMWISTNKKLSAEKPISKRLADILTMIMEFSTPHQGNKYRPVPEEQFKYQVDIDKDKFDNVWKKKGEHWMQYPQVLSSDNYTNYIKDPFNRDKTMTNLKETSPHSRVKRTKGDTSFPLHGITYESLTYNGGLLDKQVHLIDVRHYNAYLLVPRMVYHFSTKVKNNVIHNHIGQIEEVKLIKFLTRYGHATRVNPYCKIHGAYGKYTNMQNMTYINNCDDWNRIIPVTMFLVILLSACLMYQPKVDTNLLVTALNRFDYGMRLTDDTFMNTLRKFFPGIKLYWFWITFVLTAP